MLLHYGTLTDCLALAGRYFMDGHTRMNQDLFQSVGEVHILHQKNLTPWGMIEALVSSAPSLLEESALMEYDPAKQEGDCAFVYISTLSLDIPALTISKG